MKRNEKATCETCPFWYEESSQCRREQAAITKSILHKPWPLTGSEDWCGRHPDFWGEDKDLFQTIDEANADALKVRAPHGPGTWHVNELVKAADEVVKHYSRGLIQATTNPENHMREEAKAQANTALRNLTKIIGRILG